MVEVELRIVQQRQIDVARAVLLHEHVVDDGVRLPAGGGGEGGNRVLGARLVVKTAVALEPEHPIKSLGQDHADGAHRFRRFAQDTRAHFGIAQVDDPFGEGQGGKLAIALAANERMHRALPAKHHARRPAGDLGGDLGAFSARLFRESQHPLPVVGLGWRLQQTVGHRHAGFRRHGFHPLELVFGRRHV